MPEFFEVLKSRRSIRSYTEEPLSAGEIEELIELAILAPTGMNMQPWAFTVVTDRKVLARLNDIVLAKLREPEVRRFIEAQGLLQVIEDPAYNIFYGAPALIVITGDQRSPVAENDCHLAAENLFLAAHARGLGTCYMGFLLMVRGNPEVRELLRVSLGHEVLVATVVGHPQAPEAEPPKRNPPRIEWVR